MPTPNRPELDPPTTTQVRDESQAPPERSAQRRADAPEIVERIDKLVAEFGGGPGTFKARLIRELIQAALKLIPDGRETGELKLITTAVKELRYAYRVFGQYAEPHKVTIFGSARTRGDHPDYAAAVEFGKIMAQRAWMVITGAGGGIMEAGHLGPGREKSFGVAIRLPFEQATNEVIAGDQKLIHFRYFFTRKLMFLSQAEAVAMFPGGFGTLDELYETLTLVQTGKASVVPIVMLEGAGGSYWRDWDAVTRKLLLDRMLINPEDLNLYYLARDPLDAADHLTRFYRIYHSSRYVKDDLVIRLRAPLEPADMDRLNSEFAPLVRQGRMILRGPVEGEDDHLALPRLVFTHTRHNFGLVRMLIDRINQCTPAVPPDAVPTPTAGP